jgi:hypothetical protein
MSRLGQKRHFAAMQQSGLAAMQQSGRFLSEADMESDYEEAALAKSPKLAAKNFASVS